MSRFAGRDYLRARGRTASRVAGSMNKTEAAYALVLEAERRAGSIASWWYEPLRLKLAGATHYTPDFMVLRATGAVELIEVKPGGKAGALWTPDARVRIKLAAEIYPLFFFKAVHQRRGAWHVESFDRAADPGLTPEEEEEVSDDSR